MLLNSSYVFQKLDCEKIDGEGKNALFYVLNHDNIQFTKFLLAHGSDVNAVCDLETGNTATHLAFLRNNFMIILLVLKCKADLNLLNKDQLTPIDYATARTLSTLQIGPNVRRISNMHLSRYNFQLKIKEKLKQK